MNDRKKKHDQASRLAAVASLQKKLGLNTVARFNYAVAGSLEASAGNSANAIRHYAEASSAGAHASHKNESKKPEVKAKADIKKVEQKPAADEGLRRSERLKAKAAAAPVKHIPTPKKPAAPQYVYSDPMPATLTLYKPKPLVSSVDQRPAREDEGCCCFGF